MRGTIPTKDDGTLDTAALGVALKARTVKEVAYVESLKPAARGKVTGLGGKQAMAGVELEEALKDAYLRAGETPEKAATLASIASRGV